MTMRRFCGWTDDVARRMGIIVEDGRVTIDVPFTWFAVLVAMSFLLDVIFGLALGALIWRQ